MPRGVYPRKPFSERFWEKVNKDGANGCWLWTADQSHHGYAYCSPYPGQSRYAHRVAYEMLVGRIPPGQELDHLCRVRHCINPAHLEAVSHAQNVQRGIGPTLVRARYARQTRCKHGHLFSPENTMLPQRRDGLRVRACRICKRASWRKWSAKKEAAR